MAEAQHARGLRCAYCDASPLEDGRPLILEHIFPESRGGDATIENTAVACGRCNSAKGNRTPLEWVWQDAGLVSRRGGATEPDRQRFRLRVPEIFREMRTNASAVARASGGLLSYRTLYRIQSRRGCMASYDAGMVGALCDVLCLSPGDIFERRR